MMNRPRCSMTVPLPVLVRVVAGAIAVAGASGCASAPPRILVRHNFAGPEKSTKVLLQDSGEKDPSSKQELYNVLIRVCDAKADNTEAQCKDTTLLTNVRPGSVY
jgi:hypothetical protein